jgi:hypothetical protein
LVVSLGKIALHQCDNSPASFENWRRAPSGIRKERRSSRLVRQVADLSGLQCAPGDREWT